MKIEQIAVGIKDLHGLDMSDEAAITLLRHALSKLAEQDVEPVADVVWFDPTIEPFQKAKPYKIIDGSLSFMDEARIGTKLYTEAQLLAAQQRTAEACAKAVERLISGDGLCADDGVWIHDCAEAIRNGEWMEYLCDVGGSAEMTSP